MLCDDCKKNEACVHITQISAEGKIDKNLCESCAAKYGDFMFQPKDKNLSVNDFLKGIFSNAQQEEPQEQETAARQKPQTKLACPNCGMSFADFLHTGKIGCSVCYDTFRRQLEPLLRRIHGSSTHSGKIPHRSGGTLELKQEIKVLRQKLQTSVEREEYEKAAEYRDKIRALEKQLAELPQEGAEA